MRPELTRLIPERRIYVDSRLTYMLSLSFNIPFFQRGKFPTSVANASQEIILPNPWAGRGNSAPFDQRTLQPPNRALPLADNVPFSIAFYLILDVAVGGTNGWFPDGVGNKPWLNGANSAHFSMFSCARVQLLNLNDVPDAMQQFAQAQSKWYPTWPTNDDDRALRVYVLFLLLNLRVHPSDT